MRNLTDKVAYITGGSKGIGYGVAESMLNQGMHVAISSRDGKVAERTAAELAEKTGNKNIIGIQSDVRSLESERKAIDQIHKKFGTLDVVLANAGVGIFKSIYEIEAEDWQAMIDTNLTGVFNTTKATIEDLKKSKGYFFSLASLAGTNFFERGSGYNASKYGVVGYTQAMMLDVRQDDVKVTTLMPGSVSTHFNGNNPSSEDEWKIQPEDIGQLIVDLLKIDPRTLPSKVEIRPSKPPKK